MTDAPRPALEFLWTLFEHAPGVIELRAFPSRQRTFAAFALTNLLALLAFIEAQCATEDVYVGVATRRDETSGKLENCLTLGAVFSDIDFKTTPEAEARQRLAAFPLPRASSCGPGTGCTPTGCCANRSTWRPRSRAPAPCSGAWRCTLGAI
jgi:hypothetical protein